MKTDKEKLLAFADSLEKPVILPGISKNVYMGNTKKEQAAAVIRELVAALDEINGFTVSQPAELNLPDDKLYRRCANELRGIAFYTMKEAAEAIGENHE